MFKIFTISILLTIITFAGAPVVKTGQTISYAEFDDGHYQAGTVREYDNVTKPGVVIDMTTGLEWQDDYSDNNNIIKSADWQGAIDYCSALGLDGGGWRIPTIKELENITDEGRYDPSIDTTVFTNIISSFNSNISPKYWSSTDHYFNPVIEAWYVEFNHGDTSITPKRLSWFVRCVREGQ